MGLYVQGTAANFRFGQPPKSAHANQIEMFQDGIETLMGMG